VLINFLRIDRMDLLVRYPRRFLVTDHVASEIADAYPDQKVRYDAAIATCQIDVCSVTEVDEVNLFLQLRPGDRLGLGECSAIAVAMKRQHGLAIDDNRAVKTAIREVGMAVEIIRTIDVMVTLIRAGDCQEFRVWGDNPTKGVRPCPGANCPPFRMPFLTSFSMGRTHERPSIRTASLMP
jgi:predicted nucleic acid-binding protein